MPFSPEEIEHKDFLLTLRGYDKEEVRAFLEAVASDYRALTSAARDRDDVPDTAYEQIGREVGTVIQVAKESATAMKRQAEAEASEMRTRADREAQKIREAATNAAKRLHDEADKYSIEARSQADLEASAKIRDSHKRLERLQSTESKVRQRLYSLEAMIANLRRELETSDELGAGELDLSTDNGSKDETEPEVTATVAADSAVEESKTLS
ncbi:MAG TPA: DivIVA domain-containing protein [Actinomycetota bacterium]|nr:DivIVA domain-containing protein [Actinomycetota bacterium]